MIYVVKQLDTRFVKIGHTKLLDKRILQIRLGNPNCVRYQYVAETNNDRAVETELHRKLDRHRITGEWFNCGHTLVKRYLNRMSVQYNIVFIDYHEPTPKYNPFRPVVPHP